MSGVISAIVVLLIIGAVAALILVIASKYMSVPENEMFPAIRECLPGANCGACGYAGCDGYAKALAEGERRRRCDRRNYGRRSGGRCRDGRLRQVQRQL